MRVEGAEGGGELAGAVGEAEEHEALVGAGGRDAGVATLRDHHAAHRLADVVARLDDHRQRRVAVGAARAEECGGAVVAIVEDAVPRRQPFALLLDLLGSDGAAEAAREPAGAEPQRGSIGRRPPRESADRTATRREATRGTCPRCLPYLRGHMLYIGLHPLLGTCHICLRRAHASTRTVRIHITLTLTTNR